MAFLMDFDLVDWKQEIPTSPIEKVTHFISHSYQNARYKTGTTQVRANQPTLHIKTCLNPVHWAGIFSVSLAGKRKHVSCLVWF